MTEAEALRVLGIEGAFDAESVRDAFAAQMRQLREARADAKPGLERERIERALTLTLMARERLLPAESRAFAVTQEVARIRKRGISRYAIGALLLGIGMLVGALLPLPQRQSETDAQPVAEPQPVSGDAAERASREALDPVRMALSQRWQQAALTQLPAQTPLAEIDLPAPPQGWRWEAQRDGAFGLVAEDGDDWVLAAPLLEDDGLRWACFTSARAQRPGCFTLIPDPVLQRRVRQGQVDARLLADVLARMPAAQGDDAWSAERWYRQALRQGGPDLGRSGVRTLHVVRVEHGAGAQDVGARRNAGG